MYGALVLLLVACTFMAVELEYLSVRPLTLVKTNLVMVNDLNGSALAQPQRHSSAHLGDVKNRSAFFPVCHLHDHPSPQ